MGVFEGGGIVMVKHKNVDAHIKRKDGPDISADITDTILFHNDDMEDREITVFNANGSQVKQFIVLAGDAYPLNGLTKGRYTYKIDDAPKSRKANSKPATHVIVITSSMVEKKKKINKKKKGTRRKSASR
jgi:hypothetical protein